MRIAFYLTFYFYLTQPQISSCQDINWVTFEKLPMLTDSASRPIMIFIHTDWCKVCAMQEETTFQDPDVVKYLNEHYYALKLNAESTTDITFLNRNYQYRSTGVETGIHELAEILAMRMGMVSYPATIILSKDNELIERLVGLQSSKELLAMLRQT